MAQLSCWIRNWSHIATHLVVLLLDSRPGSFVVLVVVLEKATSSQSPRLCRFKSDQDEIWRDFLSSKYLFHMFSFPAASVLIKFSSVQFLIGFLMWRHTFKMAGMTLFHIENCCDPVSAHATSAGCPASNSVCSSWSTVHSYLLYYIGSMSDDII